MNWNCPRQNDYRHPPSWKLEISTAHWQRPMADWWWPPVSGLKCWIADWLRLRDSLNTLISYCEVSGNCDLTFLTQLRFVNWEIATHNGAVPPGMLLQLPQPQLEVFRYFWIIRIKMSRQLWDIIMVMLLQNGLHGFLYDRHHHGTHDWWILHHTRLLILGNWNRSAAASISRGRLILTHGKPEVIDTKQRPLALFFYRIELFSECCLSVTGNKKTNFCEVIRGVRKVDRSR